jgi:hypothetical protein
MAIRWQFIEERERDQTWWIWRIMLLDGTLETQSQRFNSYGAAVGDAIRNGFKPTQHHWIVVTRHTATHYHPGEPHVSVPIVGPEPPLSDAVKAAGKKNPEAAAERSKVPPRPIRQ